MPQTHTLRLTPLMSFSSKEKGSEGDVTVLPAEAGVDRQYLVDDKYRFVGEQGGNGAGATYQHVNGAPVETTSPLGYNVGWWSALFLNIAMIIGTGIFSTRRCCVAMLTSAANILKGTGSVGLALLYWVIGLFISLAGISVYLELMSYFPSRSGAEVVYLEQAYPRPKYFFPIAFAFQTVVLSFSSSNAFGRFQIRPANTSACAIPVPPVEPVRQGLGAQGGRHCDLDCGLPRGHLQHQVVDADRKRPRCGQGFDTSIVRNRAFADPSIVFTGFAVLGGGFKGKVADPNVNFRNAFEGTSNDGYGISNALVSIIFSYAGFNNSFNLANEVANPVRTIKRTANTALVVVAILYVLVNVAYFAALPKLTILNSKQITATLYFETLFGSTAAKGLTILPILSAAGNMLAVFIGHSRMVREIGRQGVLPWPRFWISTRPFGTPAGAQIFTWFVSVIMVLIPPAGNAFNFIISLSNYPSSFFLALMTFGLFLIRRQRKALNLPKTEYRGWTVVAWFYLLVNVFLLIMPWVPPKAGVNASSFNFFYAASSLTGLGL